MAQQPQFLLAFNNAIEKLSQITSAADRDSARLSTERQTFTRDAKARLATMSAAVTNLNQRVRILVDELTRFRSEVNNNESTVKRNLEIIDRLNAEIDRLRSEDAVRRGQSSQMRGNAPVIQEGYADIQKLQLENRTLIETNRMLQSRIEAATPLMVNVVSILARINENPIPTAEILAEMDRLNKAIEDILALLPAPRGNSSTPSSSSASGIFSSLFGSSTPTVTPPASSYLQQPSVSTSSTNSTNSSSSLRPSDFFDVPNSYTLEPPMRRNSFGGKKTKQKGGFVYNKNSKMTFKSKSSKRPRKTKQSRRSSSSSSKSSRTSKTSKTSKSSSRRGVTK